MNQLLVCLLTLLFSLNGPAMGEYSDFGRTSFGAKTVGRTNGQIVQDIATRADAWGSREGLGLGSRAGRLKHGYADRLLTRYQSLYGDRGLSMEVSYLNGQAGVGGRGSIRLDVVDGAIDNPTSVFDYKFGKIKGQVSCLFP